MRPDRRLARAGAMAGAAIAVLAAFVAAMTQGGVSGTASSVAFFAVVFTLAALPTVVAQSARASIASAAFASAVAAGLWVLFVLLLVSAALQAMLDTLGPQWFAASLLSAAVAVALVAAKRMQAAPASARWGAAAFALLLAGTAAASLMQTGELPSHILFPVPAVALGAWLWHAVPLQPAALRLARLAGRAAFYVLVPLAGALALLLFVNAFDEELHPEVAAHLDAPSRYLHPAENAFYSMVGLAAPAGEDAHAAGFAYIDRVRRIVPGSENTRWPDTPGSVKPVPMCDGTPAACFKAVGESPGKARAALASHGWLLERYRTLIAYRDYDESYVPRSYEAPLPPFVPIAAAQRLLLIDAALRLQKRDYSALDEVRRSLAFGRLMLANSRTVIGKMVANRQARNAALFISEALAEHRIPPRLASKLVAALDPLSAQERSLQDALRAEFLAVPSVFGGCRSSVRNLGADAWASELLCPFLKENASVNYVYFRHQKPALALMALPPAEMIEARRKSRASGTQSAFDWTFAYNPAGKWLASSAQPEWSDYGLRMHDLDATLRLAAVQALVKAGGVKLAEVPAFVARVDKRYSNPYTGAAMRWDAGERKLYFEPQSSGFVFKAKRVEARL